MPRQRRRAELRDSENAVETCPDCGASGFTLVPYDAAGQAIDKRRAVKLQQVARWAVRCLTCDAEHDL
jgi:predicted  nucleic acid-binding Zn-ribbon protein